MLLVEVIERAARGTHPTFKGLVEMRYINKMLLIQGVNAVLSNGFKTVATIAALAAALLARFFIIKALIIVIVS